MVDLDGMDPTLDREDLGIERLADAPRIERRTGDEHPGPALPQDPEEQIRIDRALVKLVEHHEIVRPGPVRPEHPTKQQTFGEIAEPGPPTFTPLGSSRESDLITHFDVPNRCDPSSEHPCGEPARLGDEDPSREPVEQGGG